MSVLPSDSENRLETGGFQPLNPPPPDSPWQPPIGKTTQFPYPQPSQPTTPRPRLTSRGLLIIVVAVFIAIILIVVFTTRKPPVGSTPTPSSSTSHVQVSPTTPIFIPGSSTPIDLAYSPVVEAIDLPSQPTLGTAWNAGDLLDMVPNFFVTQCGVFVTELSSYATGDGANATLTGYEISTGAQGWEVNLHQATGLNDPRIIGAPTYTTDCKMVVVAIDMSVSEHNRVVLMVDLASGQTSGFVLDDYVTDCAAAGTVRVACWYDDHIQLIDFVTHTSTSKPTGGGIGQSNGGDVVVDNMVWSEEGYQDPLSGEVIFGQDVIGEESRDEWIVYNEALLPGGYRSGFVVRLQGPLFTAMADCSIMAWDVSTNQGLWAEPASIPCSGYSGYHWIVAGSALIASMEYGQTRAFSLADGSFLWVKSQHLDSTAWGDADESDAHGVTSDYAFLYNDLHDLLVVGVADGTVISFPRIWPWTVLTTSSTIAYFRRYVSDTESLGAFPLGDNGVPAWTLDLPGRPYWTFATGGTMYVIYNDNGSARVAPLIE